jgi:ribonuclease HI/probable phosphoglycerate mutase
MYFDGSLKLGGVGVGVLFISPDRKQLKYVRQILWQGINNEAEYEALIHGLRVEISLGIKRLLVYGDSAVVVNQVNTDWDCTKDNMDAYYAEVRNLKKHFQGLEILLSRATQTLQQTSLPTSDRTGRRSHQVYS